MRLVEVKLDLTLTAFLNVDEWWVKEKELDSEAQRERER